MKGLELIHDFIGEKTDRIPGVSSAKNIRHKGRWLLLGLGLWTLPTWDATPIPEHAPEFPIWDPASPPEVVAAIADWVAGTPSKESSADTTSPPTPTSIVGGANPTTDTFPGTELTTPTLGPTSVAPATPETPTVPTVAPVVTTLPLTAALNEHLPNPKQYSEAAGSVTCSGPEVDVTILPDGGPALGQLRDATGGEGWTASALPPGTRNPLDEHLYAEVLQDSGYPDGQPPAGPYVVYIREGCSGLEQ